MYHLKLDLEELRPVAETIPGCTICHLAVYAGVTDIVSHFDAHWLGAHWEQWYEIARITLAQFRRVRRELLKAGIIRAEYISRIGYQGPLVCLTTTMDAPSAKSRDARIVVWDEMARRM